MGAVHENEEHSSETKRRASPRFYLLVVATGAGFLTVGCISLELGYRLVRQHSLRLPIPAWVEDPDLIYKLNPANPNYPESFRGKAPNHIKRAEFRVICLGGSTTYGHGVGPEEAWPAVVERRLQTKGIEAEVVNAGVPGYGSRQLLVRYRRDLSTLRADYVVVYEGWNRTGALVDPSWWIPFGFSRPQPGEKLGWVLKTHLVLHSLILQRIATSLEFRREEASWSMDPYQNIFVEDFTELMTEIKAHHQEPVLVLYPALYFPGMTPEEQSLLGRRLFWARPFRRDMVTELEQKHAALPAIAQSTCTPLIDVQGAFSSSRGRERTTLFLDEMHLSVRGNQKAGEVIGDFLGDLMLRRKLSALGSQPADKKSGRPTPGRMSVPHTCSQDRPAAVR